MARRIVVIGDVVVDAYYDSKNKKNREGSSPCYRVGRKDKKYRPGCAGNVAANLMSLGSECDLISVIGKDENGNKLEKALGDLGIPSVLIRDSNWETIEKARIIDKKDKRRHCRIDFEEEDYNGVKQTHVKEIISNVIGKNYSYIVIPDYNKGMISRELIDELKKTGIPILADTKPNHIDFFKDVYLIKPNRDEVIEMTGIKNTPEAARELRNRINTRILLTRGEEGISYFGLNGETDLHYPAHELGEVIDPTGAGDSVMAAFVHYLEKGFTTDVCVKMANRAGAEAVLRSGCYLATAKDLEGYLNCINVSEHPTSW